jgi:hypothetical protein
VEVEIEGLGVLQNPVVAADFPPGAAAEEGARAA